MGRQMTNILYKQKAVWKQVEAKQLCLKSLKRGGWYITFKLTSELGSEE